MTDAPRSSIPDGPGDPDWPARMERMHDAELPPRRAELRRLADAARDVLHGLVITDADTTDIRDAADRLDAIAGLFRGAPKRSIYEIAESANSGDPWGFFDHSPMLGRANPLAPPIVLRPIDDRTLEGTATFGAAYEGPPGCVHGGYVAAAFDEVLGSAQSLSGQPGMTARLIVNYRSPTPLHTELHFIGRFDRVEGRKVFASGTVHAEETLCAEAEGLFVSIDSERFQGLRSARDDRAGDAPSDA